MSALPAVVDLIPHRPPMLLVDEVVAHEGLKVVCRTTIRDDMPFVEDGEVPLLVAIELFAQSAATLIALLASRGGEPMTEGALLGTRRIDLHGDVLRVGDVVEIRCEERMALGVTAQIECSLFRVSSDGTEEEMAAGSINVMAGVPS